MQVYLFTDRKKSEYGQEIQKYGDLNCIRENKKLGVFELL